MTAFEESPSVEQFAITPLARIADRQQVWSRMAAKYGVTNPVPPWKSSLDGICDALDPSSCSTEVLSFVDRRNEEDLLSSTLYADLPYPENQLLALAHSLVVRSVVKGSELEQRLTNIRARLET